MNRPREIRRRADRRSGGGNCWCPDPAQRRRRFPQPARPRPIRSGRRAHGRRRYPAFGLRLRAPQGRCEAACPHSSKVSFLGPNQADEEFPFTETLAAPSDGATAVGMAPCPIRRCRPGIGALSGADPRNRAKSKHFRCLSMQDHTSSSALENAIALQKFGVGQPVRRKEDDTLVRGKGKYTDDFNLPGQAYAWIVRSTHAHGIIRGIDTSAAKAMPCVRGVCTGTDLAAANSGPYTCGLPLKSRDGTPLLQTNRTALMTDKVRYVGDPVAFVVAETLAQARDAGEAVVVDIDPLPAVTDPVEAAKPGAPQLYDHIPNNVALDYHFGDAAKVEAAFASAAHVTKLDIVNTRVAVVAMEPRAGLASYDKASERYTIQVPTQGVAGNRTTLAKGLLKVPNEKVHLLTANVGGSFGMKNINYPEYICILHAGT